MSIISKILIPFFSKKVGQDEFGNRYYLGKNSKRYVVYNGIAEPSKVPSEWHGWLHYSSNLSPAGISTRKLSWQKIHLPNLTGTKNSYKSSNTNPKQKFQPWVPSPLKQNDNHEQV